MIVGQRVVVRAAWSSFVGQLGVVTQARPYLMVRIEGERQPMRFGDAEVAPLSEPAHIGGAE